MFSDYKIKKKNFNKEIGLDEFIYNHNHSVHSTTKRRPIDIKDLEDQEEIDQINLNIIKSMSRKIKDELNIKKFDVLLLSDNKTINNNNIQLNIKMENIFILFLVDLSLIKIII